MELNKLSNEAYNAYVQSKAKPSPMGKNMVWAFLVGGLICVIGQGLLDWYQTMGLSRELAARRFRYPDFPHGAAHRIGVFDSFAKHAARGRWSPSQGLPTRWWRPPWSLSRRDWSPGPPPNSLPWLARCWSMGFPPVCSMA